MWCDLCRKQPWGHHPGRERVLWALWAECGVFGGFEGRSEESGACGPECGWKCICKPDEDRWIVRVFLSKAYGLNYICIVFPSKFKRRNSCVFWIWTYFLFFLRWRIAVFGFHFPLRKNSFKNFFQKWISVPGWRLRRTYGESKSIARVTGGTPGVQPYGAFDFILWMWYKLILFHSLFTIIIVEKKKILKIKLYIIFIIMVLHKINYFWKS